MYPCFGVMQLLNMIIADAKRTDGEMNADEQQAQKDYAGYVAATTDSINADREAIAEKDLQWLSVPCQSSRFSI